MTDRGYINLLSHLNQTTTTLPISTIQASVAHYLAHVQPLPTAFTAIVISSQLLRALTLPKLEFLSTSFRHAVHFKLQLIQDEPNGLFSRSLKAKLEEWVYAVLKGLQGGQTMLRLAAYDGLLLGLEDVESEVKAKEGRMRGKVEEELVIALAEAMDMYPLNASSVGWETEFMPNVMYQTEGCTLSTAYLIIARSLPIVANHRLKALPLGALTSGLLAIIDSAFQSGAFLSSLEESLTSQTNGKLCIEPASQFTDNLRTLSSSPIIVSMAALSRLCALSLSALADSRPRPGWLAMSEVMQRLEILTRNVEADWLKSRLAGTEEENDIAPESHESAKVMWSTLKTLLFTTIMIVQSVLSTLVYVPQPPQEKHASSSSSDPSPHSFALTALHIFSHLSFVLPQFGGVTSTAQGGFVELKKVFYTALDILSSDQTESEKFVRLLCDDARAQATSQTLPLRFVLAKNSYSLACIEQLVPVLSDDVIRAEIWPMCQPHLSDASHREVYESSHSVMLAVFAAHAQRASEGKVSTAPSSLGEPAFAEQIVPFYVQCLISNSGDGALSTTQLCLAYAALVRAAGAFCASASQLANTPSQGDSFAWFCVEALLQHIRRPSSGQNASVTSSKVASFVDISEHFHRLHLALISTVPSVSLTLLPRLLSEVRSVTQSYPPGQIPQRDELVQALFHELSHNVGDLEKEVVMEWWYENCEQLVGPGGAELTFEGTDKSEVQPSLVSRL
ncbi:hypothetical protein EUX98_g2725 [Antrodiella citrinella]|uniref:Uncharacterized protein n=1 Tax=Antrodiella citrinella TaxID=2447956 RepID=A0A4V3XJ26_9APHY|nr:hypothetical protein EUX98_g2725 [Antrodiella citrinella]